MQLDTFRTRSRTRIHIAYIAGMLLLSCWMPWTTVRPLSGASQNGPTPFYDFAFEDGATIQFNGWTY